MSELVEGPDPLGLHTREEGKGSGYRASNHLGQRRPIIETSTDAVLDHGLQFFFQM